MAAKGATISPVDYTKHNEKVERVRAAVRAKPEGKTISIRKNTPHHQIHNQAWKDKCYRVDVSELNEVLGYEEVTNRDGERVIVAVCEGQVTMGQVSSKALRDLGMIPQVVPEYDNFTCAGLVNGEGIQTSAHRHGPFTNTLTRLEAVLGDASVKQCTPELSDPDRELFMELREAYGSLGIVTLVWVTLRPAKAFVRSSFQLFRDSKTFADTIYAMTRRGEGDFLEGLVLAKDSYLIVRSDFADAREEGDLMYEPGPSNYGELWYYQHLRQRVVKDNTIAVEHDCIPTLDFLFRSVRGAWWMIECHVGWPWLTNQRWVRQKADREVEKEMQQKGGFGAQSNDDLRCVVLQDMGIRLQRLQEGIDFVNRTLGVYPLWVCPVYQLHIDKARRLGIPMNEDGVADDEHWRYFCDIGIYGEPTVKPFYHRRAVKSVIDFVDFPSTWGTTYKKKEEIAEERRPAREKYKAIGAFTGVEDKVTLADPTSDANSTEQGFFMWRLRRDYGRLWFIVVPAILLTLLGVLVGALYAVALLAMKVIA